MIQTRPLRRRFGLGPSRTRSAVDRDFYASCHGRLLEESGLDAAAHFAAVGQQRGLRPSQDFDPCVYLAHESHPDLSFHRNGTFSHDPEVPATMEALADHLEHIDDRRIYGATTGKERKDFAAAERDRNLDAAPGYADAYTRPVEHTTTGLTMFSPSFDEVHQRIIDRTPTTFVKVPHGFWDSLLFVEAEQRRLRDDPRFARLDDAQCFALACRMVAEVQPEKGVYADGFYDDLLAELATAVRDDELLIGFSYKGYPTWDNRLFIVPGNTDEEVARIRLLERYLPPGYAFCDGTLLKRWTLSGRIATLMESLVSRPVVIVGAEAVQPVIGQFGLERAVFHRIPPRNSHWHRYQLFDEVAEILSGMDPADAPVVLTRAGGSLSFWLLLRLRRRFPTATFLDVGQSLNPFLIDSPDTKWTREYESILFDT